LRAINNIFRNKSNSEAKRENIFAGDTVGGASASPGDTNVDDFVFEDPFVSAEELPLLLKPTVRINKHRWAHEISTWNGCVLVANEKLGGVFHQTVVLLLNITRVPDPLVSWINR
jgi:putative transcriptional regulator